MEEYEAQLLAVEQALQGSNSETERAELLALKENLLELAALTQLAAESEAAPPETAQDAEMQRFMQELNELDNVDDTQQAQQTDAEELAQLEALRTKYSGMVGEKCAAPHEHSWGAISYHNAIICGIDDEVAVDTNVGLDVRLRVLFTNPTHREMLPCEYYLEGECRFDASRCHYSHGELVSARQIKDYQTPDFTRLARNCVVLAKLKDRLWHRGRVLCVNFMEQKCFVRMDSKEHKERERDFAFEELFPIVDSDNEDDELSSDSTPGSDNDASNSDDGLDDYEAVRRARLVEQSLFHFKPTQRLGEWEQYTKGIGSKLMAKMGYIHGTGLGSDGRGIVTPVSAQILPPGRSLDACMAIREAANGDKNYFSVEKKLKRAQKKQQAVNEKAYAREAKRVDVFSFLNGSVFGHEQGTLPAATTAQERKSNLQEQTTKSLNVAAVRIGDEIRRKKREITKVEESIKRNTRDIDVQKRLQTQRSGLQQQLRVLEEKQRTLSKEQNVRKSKNKLFEF